MIVTSASIGLLHTLLGPDHYLPFLALRESRKWSLPKTGLITLLCGVGHIASSVLLGTVGIALGVAVTSLEAVESFRGDIAAWALIAFGLAYFAWGLRKAMSNHPHTHFHIHRDDIIHSHNHTHTEDHIHLHENTDRSPISPWILFTIFVLGPCEPLIPLLMYPAARESTSGLLWVTAVFGAVTIVTMLAVVTTLSLGVNLLPLRRMDRYVHAFAGGTLLLCGTAIRFLGL